MKPPALVVSSLVMLLVGLGTAHARPTTLDPPLSPNSVHAYPDSTLTDDGSQQNLGADGTAIALTLTNGTDCVNVSLNTTCTGSNEKESASQPSGSASRLSPGMIAGGVIAGIGATCALFFACWFSRKKSTTSDEDNGDDEEDKKKSGILQSLTSFFGSPDTKDRQSPEPANFAPPHWLFARLAGPSGLNQNDVEYVGPMCAVATQYNSTTKDELTLQVGDKVKLKRVFKDGWGLAENLTTGSEGILPLSSLEFADFGMFPAFASTALANAAPRRRSVSAIKLVPGYSQSSSTATLTED